METADDLEQKLTCSICLQLFQDPRLLPCGHTYCQHCLTSYINSKPPTSNSRGQQGFHCPVCREFLPAPDRMTPPHMWACRFKPNFLIRDIVEVHGKNKRRGADGSNSSGGNSYKPTCPRHLGKPLELYCRDCRMPVCDRCVALKHRKCEEVVELAEVSRETQQAARKHQQTVTRLLKQLEAKKRRCMTGRRELERIERDMDAQIEREGQELLRKVADFLRSRKESLKRQAHAHCRQCVNVVNAYTEKCDELTEALRSMDRVLASKLRPDSSRNKNLDLQEERKLSGMIQKLELAVQQLDSPCHFTVRLIMDDSALTAILSTLQLGEIRTGDHTDSATFCSRRPASVASSSATSQMNLSANGWVGHQQSMSDGVSSSSAPERPSSACSSVYSSSPAPAVHQNNSRRSSPMSASFYDNASPQLPVAFSPGSVGLSFSTSSFRSASASLASASGNGTGSAKAAFSVTSSAPHQNHRHRLRGRVISDSRLSSHAANNDNSNNSDNGRGRGEGEESSNLLSAGAAAAAAHSLHVAPSTQLGQPPPDQRRKSVTKMSVDFSDQPALPPRRKLSQP